MTKIITDWSSLPLEASMRADPTLEVSLTQDLLNRVRQCFQTAQGITVTNHSGTVRLIEIIFKKACAAKFLASDIQVDASGLARLGAAVTIGKHKSYAKAVKSAHDSLKPWFCFEDTAESPLETLQVQQKCQVDEIPSRIDP